MNRTLRIAALVAVVAVIGLAIGASVSGGLGYRGPHARDVRAVTDHRLSRLHNELKLSADQAHWGAISKRASTTRRVA